MQKFINSEVISLARFFNEQEIELLAPAGTFEIFKEVIKTGADAVYFGGKILNMRMHRKGFNFTFDEIEKAVALAHSKNKKVYITVNNLLNQKDLQGAVDYLQFLEKIKPDALLIQDLGLLQLIQELKVSIPLHASVMMNVHNLQTIQFLQDLGVSRCVMSREMSLSQVENLHHQSNMEFEYFIHGDMCIAHGGQCLYSGILFGKSSNRGLCMKPCRWNYSMKQKNILYSTEYPMAVKDMYMYEHLPELIDAGVSSFKIEGRMREAEYLVRLIENYAEALDRYIEDPFGYDQKKNAEKMVENRMRDFSTGYAFGNPGLKNINRRWEGTGKFYSHGKVFSKPIEELEMTWEKIEEIKNLLQENPCRQHPQPELSLRVNSYEQGKLALSENADILYLSGDTFQPDAPFTKEEIHDLLLNKGSSKILLALPRMMWQIDFAQYTHYLHKYTPDFDGLLITNLGCIPAFESFGYSMFGDYSLNLYNQRAMNFYKEQGLHSGTISVEAPVQDAVQTVQNTNLPVEIIVHGSPTVMYLEHDLYENTKSEDGILYLVDDKEFEHPVHRDQKGRNHMLLYKDLCYLPFLKELVKSGYQRFRIEGAHMQTSHLREIIRSYRKGLDHLDQCTTLFESLPAPNKGYTLGAFNFK